MNCLRPSLSRALSKQIMTRRLLSSHTYKPKSIDFTNLEKKLWNVQRDWFSDPSVYPLFVAVGCAFTLAAGAVANSLIRYKDVTIRPTKRNSMLQTWGYEDHYDSTLKKVIAWNAYGEEGLGVDHEEWLKEKEASMEHAYGQ